MNFMTADKEYKVLVTHFPLGEADEQEGRWRATLLGFPYIVEEAISREEVINQIKARIDEILRNSEIITLTAPTPLLVTNGTETDLAIQGWDDHGLFKDDPEALKLFDEIEEERDRHLVGSE
jgi:hypothetical protein